MEHKHGIAETGGEAIQSQQTAQEVRVGGVEHGQRLIVTGGHFLETMGKK